MDKSKIAIAISTFVMVNDIRKAAKMCGVSYNTLSTWLSKYWFYQEIEDPGLIVIQSGQLPYQPVRILNIETGIGFTTLLDAARSAGMPDNSLYYKMANPAIKTPFIYV